MSNQQQTPKYKLNNISNAIALFLLIEGIIFSINSFVWVFTNDNTDKWFYRFSLSIICFGFSGIIFKLKDKK